MSTLTEPELVDAWRLAQQTGIPPAPEVVAGIDAAFAGAQSRVYAMCRRICGSDELAQDLAQESLLTGYRKLATWRGEGKLSTWLVGIAKGLSLNAVRKHGELLSEDGVLDDTDATLGVVSMLRRAEREALLHAATAELDPVERQALHLRYVEQLPQDRITELLGITESSGARGVLQRCRRRLQRELRARLTEMGHGSSFFQVTR